jgi:acyl-CoA-binding protein
MKWYVDFDSWCEIEASSKEEAEQKFWEIVTDGHLSCQVVTVSNVEPVEEEEN